MLGKFTVAIVPPNFTRDSPPPANATCQISTKQVALKNPAF
jgi:hypothetical protein